MSNQPLVAAFFEKSPFSNVADEESARCWAGRPKVYEGLVRLQRMLSRMPDSTLDVLWANLGAGKTHTLWHLAYMLQGSQPGASSTHCVFVEMPEQVRNFHELYRRIISAMPIDRVALLISACRGKKIDDALLRAANVLTNGGPPEREVVADWLRGGRPLLRDLRQCSGISSRIEDDVTATDLLCGIAQAYAINRIRLVIMIDEFQRIGVLKAAARNKILSCVRTIFSRTPSYLSMLFSIQSMVEQSALEFVPPELRTLLGKKPTISLPSMDQSEAKDFILQRFRFFRAPDYKGDGATPFLDTAVDAILHFLTNEAEIQLTPREVIQAFALVYAGAEAPEKGIAGGEAVTLLRNAYATHD